MKTKFTLLFILLLVAVTASACGGASSVPQGEMVSILTQQEAIDMIGSALQAFNTGDYAVWSRDWDSAMKSMIDEKSFQEYRNQILATYGQYVSLESVDIQPGTNKGYVRWVAIANFEKGKIKFGFGFLSDGREITGILPEAVE